MRDWDIVVAVAAIPSECYAAQEFRDHFERAANVNLPIVTSTHLTGRTDETAPRPAIWLAKRSVHAPSA